MTRRSVVTSARADDDIAAAVDFSRDEGEPDAVAAFVDELRSAFELVAEHPSIGSSRLALEAGIDALRSVALQRFPYLVFYLESSEEVRVIRVLHTRRDLPAEFQRG